GVAPALEHADDAGVSAAAQAGQHRDLLAQEIALDAAGIARSLDRSEAAGLFVATLGHDAGSALAHARQDDVGPYVIPHHLAQATRPRTSPGYLDYRQPFRRMTTRRGSHPGAPPDDMEHEDAPP